MAFFTIPIPAEIIPFSLQVDLDGDQFTLGFRFMPRDGYWRVSVSKGGESILSSVKIVRSDDLLAQYIYIEELPLGKFIVYDQDDEDSDPGEDDFGNRVLLMYQDAS